MAWINLGQVSAMPTTSVSNVTRIKMEVDSNKVYRFIAYDINGNDLIYSHIPNAYNTYSEYSPLDYDYRARVVIVGGSNYYLPFTPSDTANTVMGELQIFISAGNQIDAYIERQPKNTAPTMPGNLSVSGSMVKGNTITLSWGAASDPDGDIIYYDLDVSYNAGSTWSSVYSGTSRSKSFTLPTNQTQAMFRVRARDSNGATTNYRLTSNATLANPNAAPTTPGAFTSPASGTVLKGGQAAIVQWGASSDAEGDAITYKYRAMYSVDGVTFTTPAWNSTTSRAVNETITANAVYKYVKWEVYANDGTVNSSPRESVVYTINHNTAPTLTLNTADNQTLSESAGQNELLVEGTAKDTDANNTVTVRMQINDGTIRNIASAISDGSTEIPFSRLLSYRDQRIYDGETPISNALSEGIDHKLKVWSDDGQGGISEIAERKFRVIHNRPPVVSDTDRDLGTLIESPSVVYQVNDLEGQAVTVTEKINGQVIRTFEAVANEDNTLEIPLEMWIPLQLQQHTLTIEATDTFGAKTTRTYTFTRTEDTILLELKNPFETDIAATRILVTPEVYVPIGSTIKIEACNNAFDDVPTWEDITSMAMNKRGFSFTNTTKTADQWGINIRFTLEKGTATQEVRLDGFGGAFD